MSFVVIHGDCLEVMDMMPSNSVDSIVTDPPYGLNFMGKDWDHGVPGVPFWQQALRAAKPGAYLLAAGGSRTFHRLVVAVEDAGWEIRDTVLWVYGSGFPKSLDVSKAIDKAAGAEREVVAQTTSGGFKRMMETNAAENFRPDDYYPEGNKFTSKEPVTEAAKQWEGFGTALKPAFEPWVLARKPLEGTVIQNVQKWGTGALNIDGCRVPLSGDFKCGANGRPSQTGLGDNYDPANANKRSEVGRWPANFIHDGSDEVVSLFPESKGQAGDLRAGIPKIPANCFGQFGPTSETPKRGDTGSAARFFYVPKASVADREEGLRDGGVGASRDGGRGNTKPRFNGHPTVKPTELMRYLCRLITPPGGVVLDPFAGSGSTGRGAILEGFKFIGIEQESAYVEIARRRIDAARAAAVTGEN